MSFEPNLGLYGGQIYEIVIDPVNPDKMFAGAYRGDGLFLTENGGKTWKPVLTSEEGGGLDGEATFRNTAVWAVAMAPSNHNVVWATHDKWVEISRDGGKNWTHVKNSTMQRDCTGCSGDGDNFRNVKSLAVDPKNPLVAHVGTSGPNGSAREGAIYKTTNGGISWTKQGIVGSFYESQCGYYASLENEFYSTVTEIVTLLLKTHFFE